ncbi:Retrovirus-related Pol polyprotein from transposon gypsy [Thelohanellus kitauei]|uniref:Retrovirus-related Pol polyprotein from transposon gypsy n=1 Tax=Thelohanellus kitauei TaxID=669202 RepID=A0A0C2JN89_THEKT|nr:Retrovirus-related Pol polyprotein from transposon gypsy [Thelohanellus kitauei]
MNNQKTAVGYQHIWDFLGQTWKWEKRHQDVFNEIKNTISSHDTLQLFNPEQQIIITTDASNDGIGAVLLQKDQNEFERPVMHVSRTLKKAENNYSTTEKEALAIIYAVKKFNEYIYGRKFNIVTDHKPLEGIFDSKSGLSSIASSRITRWWSYLAGYNYMVTYRSGK